MWFNKTDLCIKNSIVYFTFVFEYHDCGAVQDYLQITFIKTVCDLLVSE